MSHNDDDEIKNIAVQGVSAGENSETFLEGKTETTVTNNPVAPLAEKEFNVMFELTGAGCAKGRPGLDLITVLDVRLGHDTVEGVLGAMDFVLSKLSPLDRLSVVVFSKNSGKAHRFSNLAQVTQQYKAGMKNVINYHLREPVHYGGSRPRITDVLELALQLIMQRRFKKGRAVAIMLISDCAQNISKAAEYNFIGVPVFTFGFGIDHEPMVFKTNIGGGTFSYVQNPDDLRLAVAQCLGGLLTEVVEHLEVTFRSIKSKIIKVCAGNYKQVSNGDSITITFGNLYINEVRTVIVELLLPAVTRPLSADVLEISYTYKSSPISSEDVVLFDAAPIFIRVTRKGIAAMPDRPEMKIEQGRILTAQMMKDARILADQNNLKEARKKLAEAQNLLENIVPGEDNPVIEMMKYECSELLDMMQSDDVYAKQGRPFALSSESSHDRQRQASRGDICSLSFYCTKRMGKYAEQVEAIKEDPTKSVPTEEEDIKQELDADPLAPIAGALSYHLQNAIRSLQAIDKILKKPLNA